MIVGVYCLDHELARFFWVKDVELGRWHIGHRVSLWGWYMYDTVYPLRPTTL